jgi:hypothetical protein
VRYVAFALGGTVLLALACVMLALAMRDARAAAARRALQPREAIRGG